MCQPPPHLCLGPASPLPKLSLSFVSLFFIVIFFLCVFPVNKK